VRGVEAQSIAILRALLADFRLRNYGLGQLSSGYVGLSIPSLRQKCCRGNAQCSVDFELAMNDLEEKFFVGTGPTAPIEPPPGAPVLLVGIISKREYAYLTEKGYRAAVGLKEASQWSKWLSPRHIGIYTLALTFTGVLAAVAVVPEVRYFLGLERRPTEDSGTKQRITSEVVPAVAPAQAGPEGPMIVKAIIKKGNTIQLPPGHLYLYGMVTGGGARSGEFDAGKNYQAVNAAGQLSAVLAVADSERNTYRTETSYPSIGGVSIGGTWRTFEMNHGSNSEPGASEASVTFRVRTKSLVVVIGLASSQQDINVSGIPGLQTDAFNSGQGMIIAHAYLERGSYTAVEHSAALARGQDPQHMTDLIGIFVFGST
jgi:hypothetical protein